MSSYAVIGHSPARVDALKKVTGRAMFTADFTMPGLLYLKMVRSPLPYARIKSIDTSRAENLPGVRGILRPEDAPGKRLGAPISDRYLLPVDGIVRFVGEPVVVIAADSADIAQQAVELVKVDYEALTPLFDCEEAYKKDQKTQIRPDRTKYFVEVGPRYPDLLDPECANLQQKVILRTGDIEKGFKEADVIVENRYVAETLQHCPIETHIVDAWMDEDDRLNIRSSRQGYFSLKRDISMFFDMPQPKFRIFGPYVGGGFGSKLAIFPDTLAAWVAMKLRKPVRYQYTREDDLSFGGRRERMVIQMKHGAKKTGELVAVEIKLVIDSGAYASDRAPVVARTATNGLGPVYRTPNMKVDAYAVYTNRPPCCSMRGVGVPQAVWAREQQMDILAEKLGMDPVELRRKNILKEGEEDPLGEPTEPIGMQECITKAVDWIESEKLPQTNGPWVYGRGLGIGPALCAPGYPVTSMVRVTPEGVIKAYYGSAEMGQGIHTVIAQIVAEQFKTTCDKVDIKYGDTDTTALDWDNRGSRTTVSTGMAVIRACEDAKKQIFELAAAKLKCQPSELDIKGSEIYKKASPQTEIKLESLFTPMSVVRGIGEIIGRGEYCAPTPPVEVATGRSKRMAIWAYAACAAEIAVNTETGEIKVNRMAGAFDVGYPINAKNCEQQIEGGIGMGISTILFEELKYDNGRVTNSNLTNYKIAAATEVPSGDKVATFLVSAPLPDGPYGAKGFGEVVMVGVGPAISNALYNATGARLYSLPLARYKVLEAIKKLRESGSSRR